MRTERRKERLREVLRKSKERGTLTPEAVAAFAALCIVDDDDLPINPAPHHWLWLRLLCDTRIKKLIIQAPPDSAKTTWAVSAFCGAHIGFWPEANIIIASSSGQTAKKRSQSLRVMIESAAFRSIFPGVKQARNLTWEMVEWSVAEEGLVRPGRLHPSVSAYGTGGAITGSRADIALGDDILDFENTRTQHQIDTVYKWVHNSLLSRVKARRGRSILIGTPWTHNDAYATLISHGGYVVCRTPILSREPDGEVYGTITYPDNWPYPMIGEVRNDPRIGEEELYDDDYEGAAA